MLKIDLTPQDIENLVKDSVMKSGFGDAVTKAIQGMFTAYNNPIDAELRKYVGRVAEELVHEKFAAQIKEAIAAHIEKTITKEIIDSVVSKSVSTMMANVERY